MTVKDILQNAYSISGQFVSNPIGIRLINNAVNLLINRHETASNIMEIPVTIQDGESYELPDVLGIKRVLKDGRYYKDYKVRENQVVFKDNGEYILYIFPMPAEVVTEDDIPDINSAYHSILELYVASRIPRPYDRELEQEFGQLAAEIDLRLQRGRQKNGNLPRRVWR